MLPVSRNSMVMVRHVSQVARNSRVPFAKYILDTCEIPRHLADGFSMRNRYPIDCPAISGKFIRSSFRLKTEATVLTAKSNSRKVNVVTIKARSWKITIVCRRSWNDGSARESSRFDTSIGKTENCTNIFPITSIVALEAMQIFLRK